MKDTYITNLTGIFVGSSVKLLIQEK